MMNRYFRFLFFILAGCYLPAINALTFNLPTGNDSVVGHMQWIQARAGDDFNLIGRRYDVGYSQLVEANPGVNPDGVQAGTIVVIPSQFILPPVPRKGVVISLAELRLYYYPPASHTVVIYPIGIGREGWKTPLGVTKIIEKTVNPVWVVPDSIKKDRAKDGILLPNTVQPGPENPLGGYRMRLAVDKRTHLIHGTNDFRGVGRRSSSGCIRLYPEDVEALYPRVSIGTAVNVIDSPYKASWHQGKLYLEAHTPLQEQNPNGEPDPVSMKKVVQTAINMAAKGTIYWDKADRITQQQNGVPQVIGVQTPANS